jgi:hypothetical protein
LLKAGYCMAQPIDLLVLAVSRVKKGVALAGMTTEADPVTGRVWVEVTRSDGPLQLGDITLPDGALIRPGDVIRWEGLQADPQPPFVEQWVITSETQWQLLRHITPERYARFFPEHLDHDPQAVLERHERSLCLVVAWRALGQEWLSAEELPEIAFDPDDIQARFGQVYLVLGLLRNKTVLVRGVHTIPAYAAKIDPAHL